MRRSPQIFASCPDNMDCLVDCLAAPFSPTAIAVRVSPVRCQVYTNEKAVSSIRPIARQPAASKDSKRAGRPVIMAGDHARQVGVLRWGGSAAAEANQDFIRKIGAAGCRVMR
jgi:hypothetical protein